MQETSGWEAVALQTLSLLLYLRIDSNCSAFFVQLTQSPGLKPQTGETQVTCWWCDHQGRNGDDGGEGGSASSMPAVGVGPSGRQHLCSSLPAGSPTSTHTSSHAHGDGKGGS